MAGTAIIHQATLTPSKAELLASWLPTQEWFTGNEVADLLAYRFVDPEGEVGIETFLVVDETGQRWQVPVTYRGAELPEAANGLINTMEHSVLGTRWVYDALFDPTYRAELVRTVLDGDHEAALSTGRQPTVQAHGTGDGSTPAPEQLDVRVDEGGFGFRDAAGTRWLVQVARRVGELQEAAASLPLEGNWMQGDGGGSATLAVAQPFA